MNPKDQEVFNKIKKQSLDEIWVISNLECQDKYWHNSSGGSFIYEYLQNDVIGDLEVTLSKDRKYNKWTKEEEKILKEFCAAFDECNDKLIMDDVNQTNIRSVIKHKAWIELSIKAKEVVDFFKFAPEYND